MDFFLNLKKLVKNSEKSKYLKNKAKIELLCVSTLYTYFTMENF